jgi:hypothetical protein
MKDTIPIAKPSNINKKGEYYEKNNGLDSREITGLA